MSSPERFAELHVDRVRRAFGSQVALAGMDLTIKGGEFVALLGPSGCGKSTALNCLAGLLPLTGGRIWLDGERIDHLPPERRGFGMVFQNYALFPHLTVRRNIAFGLAMRKVGKEELARRVAEALRLVRLEEHADKYPAQLSGGQQQRVAIARAVVLEPTLMLMDEPLSNLDASLRLEMRTEIRRLHQALGLTTVYVTHDQEEALALADRLVVLRLGEVQQVGSPEEVYAHPVNRYVAGFMGYRTMLPATVTRVTGEHVTVTGDGIDLVGLNRGGLAGGDAVVAVRPEDFTVVTGTPDPEDVANTVSAVVEIVEYHGREQAVEARLAGGRSLHLRTTSRLAPGDSVRLRVAVDRVLVFPAGSPAAPAEAAS
jgi:putative spermidine/putrescine transport system ATP-binding protein